MPHRFDQIRQDPLPQGAAPASLQRLVQMPQRQALPSEQVLALDQAQRLFWVVAARTDINVRTTFALPDRVWREYVATLRSLTRGD